MKKWTILLATLLFTGLIFWSCSGDDDGSTTEPDDNNTLTCNITTPLDSTGFYAGDSISVTAVANDDNASILEVRFLLDDNGISSVQTFPYTTKIPTDLLAVGTHTITAIAENDAGKEVTSSIFFGIIPDSPTLLNITQLNVYTFSLAWNDNSTGEDGFKIERKIDDGIFTEIGITTESTFIDSAVSKKGYGTVYYQVRAYKEIYNSDYVENNTTVGFPAPNITSVISENLTTIRLNWSDNSAGEEGFKIDKKVGVADYTIGFATVAENNETWADTNAEINENLAYRIYAYKGANTSGVAQIGTSNNIPAPTDFIINQADLTTAELTWSDNSIGEDKFEIERKLSTESDYVKIVEITGSDTTTKNWIDTTVIPNLIYNYRVKTTKDSFSSAYTLKTHDNTFLAPTNFTVTQTDITNAALSWTDNSIGEDRFEIERKLSTETTYVKIAEFTGSDTATKTWNDNTVVPGEIYDYQVKAVKDPYSSDYMMKTNFNNAFLAPSSLTVVQNNVYTFTLNWLDNSTGEDGFKIERKIDDGSFIEIASIINTSYVDSTVSKKGYGTVYYQVRAYKDTYYTDYVSNNSAVDFPAPSNLTFSQENIYTIKLDWIDNSDGEEGFKIDKKVGTAEWVVGFATVGENIKTWTDTNAEINENLEYRVYAYKGINSTTSITTSAIDNTFPAPTGLTYTKENIYTIKLDWTDNSTGEDGFKIDKKVGIGEWIVDFATIGENVKTWTDASAEINENIEYRVYAYKGANSTVSVTTSSIDNTFPAPGLLDVTQQNISIANLTWIERSIGEEKFEIERKLSTESTYIKIGEVAGDDTAAPQWTYFTDSTLVPNTTYNYKVKAVKDSYSSDYTLKTYENIFQAPSNLEVTQNNVYTFTLNWTSNSIGEDGFKIERKIDDGTFTEISSTTDTTFVDSTVAKKGYGTVYYQVRAYKSTDYFTSYTSNNSAVSFPSPSNLIVSQTSITEANLTWDDNSIGEEKFEIERKLSTEFTYTKIGEKIGSDTVIKSWNDTNLEIGLTYDYRIKAVYGTNSSNFSTLTYENTFLAPSNLSYTALTLTSLKLDWIDNTSIEDGFKIDRKVGESGSWVTDYASLSVGVQEWTDSGYDALETYYYKVRAYYSSYYSDYSNELQTIPIMVFVQGSTFQMGDHFNEGNSNELPLHSVTVSDFYMEATEVTQAEWATYMSTDIYGYGAGDNYPVYKVSWYMIIKYCNIRSIAEGVTPCYTISNSTNPADWGAIPTSSNSTWDAVICNWSANGYRLPTEAEWEYASRGGIHNADNYRYSGSDTIDDIAWYGGNSGGASHPVGTKAPNQLGLYDMSGNLRELCWDRDGSYTSDAQIDPTGSTSSTLRTIRGGDWFYSTDYCRVAVRFNLNPVSYGNNVGFRVMRRP